MIAYLDSAADPARPRERPAHGVGVPGHGQRERAAVLVYEGTLSPALRAGSRPRARARAEIIGVCRLRDESRCARRRPRSRGPAPERG
jgi:hypothetical protein